MTGFEAIEKVKQELDKAELSLTGGIYQFSKPLTKTEDEFIEINALPLAEDILQKANVNVNLFVRDVYESTPDNKRLKELASEVLAILPITRSEENIHIFLQDSGVFSDIDNNRHYVNLRLRVIMLNK